MSTTRPETQSLIESARAAPFGTAERHQAAEFLLAHTLDEGSAEAAIALAHLLDEDPDLADQLNSSIVDALHTRPDAVYKWVRIRLVSSLDAGWLFKLRQAALAALHIAITEADSETIMNWLTLIAREPISYGLNDILHHGILAAQIRVGEDEAFAVGLVQLALKRDPVALHALLHEPAIIQALPDSWRRAFCDGEGDAISILASYGIDAFLVMLARAAQNRQTATFTLPVVDQLWHFFVAAAGGNLPDVFRPESIIDNLTDENDPWLSTDVIDCLLEHTLVDNRPTMFLQLSLQAALQGDAVVRIADAINRAKHSPSETIVIFNGLLARGAIRPSELPALYAAYLSNSGWNRDVQLIVDQFARLSQQTNNFELDEKILWHLLEFGAEQEDELAARAALKRLCARLEHVEDDEALVFGIQRLVDIVEWSEPATDLVMAWWRDFVQNLSFARLSKLEKLLENQRGLDDARAIVQTLVGMRRMFGKRTLKQFADEIHLTFATLEALLQAFDSDTKRQFVFDISSARAEINATGELTPQERQILANDTKELAKLIGLLGDRRSRPSLIRREEELDRQLMRGEQLPHGAVDVLKWLAGHFMMYPENKTVK